MEQMQTVTSIFRHGEDDFSVWEVELPVSDIKKIRKGYKIEASDMETLLKEMPLSNHYVVHMFSMVEQTENGVTLTVAPVSPEFVEKYNHAGTSVRGDLNDALDALCEYETEIDIMWDDLKPDTQKRLLRMLGDNGNYDVCPITTIVAPNMEQRME